MRRLTIPYITEIVGAPNSNRTETENLTALQGWQGGTSSLRSHLLLASLTLSFFPSFLLCYVWQFFVGKTRVPRMLSRVPASRRIRGFASLRNLVGHSCKMPYPVTFETF